MGNERADLAAASALSLPGMLTWLGIQQRTILFPEFARVVNLSRFSLPDLFRV